MQHWFTSSLVTVHCSLTTVHWYRFRYTGTSSVTLVQRLCYILHYLLHPPPQALLSAPNPDDPLQNDVAELWKANEAEALKNAREHTRKYAMGN